MQKGKVTARNLPQKVGGLRYEITLDDGSKVISFLTQVQISTLTSIGETVPKIGQEVYITPSDELGRDGTVYGELSL